MIIFNYQYDFKLIDENYTKNWISKCISSFNFLLGDLCYIFCDDSYLHSINFKYLNHDTFTDIISFDYTQDTTINGDIFISIDRVKENAKLYKIDFYNELHRVIIHGVLHYMGYKDQTNEQKNKMRELENNCLKSFVF